MNASETVFISLYAKKNENMKKAPCGALFVFCNYERVVVDVDLVSSVVRSRKRSDMHQTPARATTVYTMRLRTASCPPKIHATTSKRKRPMAPQLRAPMIVSTSEILSSIINSPFCFVIFRHRYFSHKIGLLFTFFQNIDFFLEKRADM